jgi:hypothetical protein
MSGVMVQLKLLGNIVLTNYRIFELKKYEFEGKRVLQN